MSQTTSEAIGPLWATRFRRQATVCRDAGAHVYAHLLGSAADELEAEGPLLDLLAPYLGETEPQLLPLRLMAQVHRWVLQGELPELARHYPTAGGTLPKEGAWPEFRAACLERAEELRRHLVHPVQANYVSRCAPPMGAFLLVARKTGLPMRLLEVGCSGGLLLRWDHYRDKPWLPRLFDVPPPLDGDVLVVERRGCDPQPIDPTTDEGALTLKSFLYPDMVDEFQMLEEAIEVCRRVPAQVDRADGADWLPEQLAGARPGAVTVVFHSLLVNQPSEASLARMGAAIQRAAVAATPEAPLAWIRFEQPPMPDWSRGLVPFEVRLGLWPGDDDRLVATAHLFGRQVRWLG